MADFIYSSDPTLDAINTVISSVGSPPINSLSNITNVDAIDALRMLMKTSRDIQSQGWAWNREDSVSLSPDATSKRIAYTQDIIKAVSTTRYVNRGGFFYDLDSKTDIFETPIVIDEMVREVPFSDLPEPVQGYITAVTARNFQNLKLSSAELDQVLAQREMEALIKFNQLELDMGQYNLYDNNSTVSGFQAR